MLGVGPHLLDVALAAAYDLVRYLDARHGLEGADQLQDADAATRADVEGLQALAALAVVEDALYGTDVGLRQVYYVDVVTDAAAVGRAVVVAEDAQLLADACCRLVR